MYPTPMFADPRTAIGTRVDSRKPGNRAARKMVLAVKKVVEHIRKSKSPGAQAIFQEEQVRHYSQCLHRKLVNVAPQRWSGVGGVLEATIVNRVDIDGVYAREGSVNPLAPHEHDIDELYSVIKPVAELIVTYQQTHVPTGQAAALGLAALKLSTFNVDARLDVLTPARAQGRPEGAGGVEPKATSVPRCYKPADSAKTTDFVFDMQMGLHPTTADLQYVDKLASSKVHAAFVTKRITDKIITLAVELATKEMERKQAGPEQHESVAKQARPAAAPKSSHPAVARARNKNEDAATAKFTSLRLFKKRRVGANASQQPTFEPMACAEFETLRGVEAGSLTDDLGCEGVLKWWEKWEGSYPLLARAARVDFGAPAAGDAKYVEMVLFLHGKLDLFPEQIPELRDEDIHAKIPGRLSNPVPELHGLDGTLGPVDLTHDEEGVGPGEGEESEG
ncbi:unnamed protein product [Ectocarpus sp. CCAP 1310/34]|nr:unnamed protein product [Ectocarpus sp. CCAP 1310/34]